MKIEKPILKELVSIASANTSRTPNIFSCVRLIHKGEEIKIQAMDNLSVETFAEVEEAGEEFDIFVNGSNLSKAVAHFNKHVEMRVDDGLLILSEGAFVQRLKIATSENEDTWKFPQEPLQIFEMHETARKVLFNKIDSIPLPKMEGTPRGAVEFASDGVKLSTFSTTGTILTKRQYPLELPKFNLKLPTLTARLIAVNSGACKFGIMSNNDGAYMAMFKFEHVKYFTRLYHFEYPNFDGIINQSKSPAFKMTAYDLKSEVAKFADFASVKISWDNCEVSFSATSELGAMDDILSVEETYEADKIKVNPSFIAKVIANIPDDSTIEVSKSGGGIATIFFKSDNNLGVVAGLKE